MNKCYLHNLYTTKTEEGYVLHKFPISLIKELSPKGQGNAYTLFGSEIRFSILGKVKIEVSTESTAQILIYYGDYQGEFHTFSGLYTFQIEPKFDEEGLKRLSQYHRFEPNLVRIILKENMTVKSIEGEYEYPDLSKFPKQKYLAYGTSITQGRNGFTPDLNYPGIVSESLGYECHNYGMSGSAYIEKALVDFMCEKTYDLITLELSVNLLGDGYDVSVFKERLKYLLQKIHQTQPHAKVIGITILDNWRKFGFDQNRGTQSDVILYREAFKSVMKDYPHFILLNGESMLKFNHLSADLIHPSQYGMIELANHIQQIIQKPKLSK